MKDVNKRNFLFSSSKHIYYVLSFFLVIIVMVVIFIVRMKQGPDTVPENINEGKISLGESFYSCLINDGLSSQAIYRITESLKPFYDVRICRPGDKYEIISSTNGSFRSFRFYHNIWVYTVEKTTSNVYTANCSKIPMEERIVGISGSIKNSLWSAMINQGLSPDLIMRFTDIFSWQVDFLTEPRQNDKYKLVWIRYLDRKGNSIDGKILSAMYEGKEAGAHTAVIFDNKYYDIDGRSLHKQFLKAPLNYRRISSYFTKKRFHPILKIYRPHSGIDYAAQTGTPVVSIGDGTVTFCGWKKGAGKCVIIKHNSIYKTSYGHLSRYGKGIRRGVKVKQGKVIGYVGSTGLSTGPHLDFRIRKYGKFVNFLKLRIPPSRSIKAARMKEFNKIKKKRLAQLAGAFRNTTTTVSEKGARP